MTSPTKNLHMLHAEDTIIDGGVQGTRLVINYMLDLRDKLCGKTWAPVNLTTKWDGAPAIFAGIDPSDGNFFVSKKGIFNKTPKVYKTTNDVDADTSGDLNTILKLALIELPKLGIRDVIQGDFLYEKEDIKKTTIDGKSYITFHPNTIAYAVPEGSELADTILKSKIGVVWHTVYRGDSFETMSASFGEEIAGNLEKVESIWSIDATFKDIPSSAMLTKAENVIITKALSNAEKLFRNIPESVLNELSENEKRRLRVNVFINSKIRSGEQIQNPTTFVDDLIKTLDDYFKAEVDKKKTERGRQSADKTRDDVMKYFRETKKSDLVAMFTLYNYIVEAKLIIISNLNRVKNIKTFLKTENGYEVTGQEGFVAIDHMGKNALKFVDRLQFSRANFSADYIKGWTK
jgi:hypothetical protein